jgi:hypothetical protein
MAWTNQIYLIFDEFDTLDQEDFDFLEHTHLNDERKASNALKVQVMLFEGKFLQFLQDAPPGLDFDYPTEYDPAELTDELITLFKVMTAPRTARAFRVSTIKFITAIMEAALRHAGEYKPDYPISFTVRVPEEIARNPFRYGRIRPTYRNVAILMKLFLEARRRYLERQEDLELGFRRLGENNQTTHRFYTLDPMRMGRKAASSRR